MFRPLITNARDIGEMRQHIDRVQYEIAKEFDAIRELIARLTERLDECDCGAEE